MHALGKGLAVHSANFQVNSADLIYIGEHIVLYEHIVIIM